MAAAAPQPTLALVPLMQQQAPEHCPRIPLIKAPICKRKQTFDKVYGTFEASAFYSTIVLHQWYCIAPATVYRQPLSPWLI